ncbi:MAG: hypothetical protein LBP80_04000 [Treponema sp.]|nr:hypothetical protein [Treponema sp.]
MDEKCAVFRRKYIRRRRRYLSRLSSVILVVKGISLIEAVCAAFKEPDTVVSPLITGLWFEKKLLPLGRNNQKMKILKVGTKLKYSPYRNRAVRASFPVNLFDEMLGVVAATQQSESFPCSVSGVVTNRAPRNRARSLVAVSLFRFMKVSAQVDRA